MSMLTNNMIISYLIEIQKIQDTRKKTSETLELASMKTRMLDQELEEARKGKGFAKKDSITKI